MTERERPSSDSQRLLRALRVAVPVEDPASVAARRAALISMISREIEQTPVRLEQQDRRRQILRFAYAVAAIGVATLGAAWLWKDSVVNASDHSAEVQRGEGAKLSQTDAVSQATAISHPAALSHTAAASHATAVPEGTAQVTLSSGGDSRSQLMVVGQELTLQQDESVTAQFPGNTRIELKTNGKNESAMVRLSQLSRLEQTLFIESGELLVDVPEGGVERRHVMVITPHAKVEVKGTKFTVRVSNWEGRSRTQVAVQRGRVLVSWLGGQSALIPGQSWSSAESEHAREHQAIENQPILAPAAKKQTHSTASQSVQMLAPALRPRAVNASTLAEQNRLLEAALQAQKLRNYNQALTLFNQLLRDYPDSPLRSTASIERRRLIELLRLQ